jgi:hypothetical protein
LSPKLFIDQHLLQTTKKARHCRAFFYDDAALSVTIRMGLRRKPPWGWCKEIERQTFQQAHECKIFYTKKSPEKPN